MRVELPCLGGGEGGTPELLVLKGVRVELFVLDGLGVELLLVL